jgi:hypothetical protein
MIILPRQARDKHRESTQTITVYSGLPVRALTNDGEKKRRPKFNFATPFSDETSMTLPRQARGKQERIFSKVRCYAGEDTREQVRKLSLSLLSPNLPSCKTNKYAKTGSGSARASQGKQIPKRKVCRFAMQAAVATLCDIRVRHRGWYALDDGDPG